jgi:hypothetical protein
MDEVTGMCGGPTQSIHIEFRIDDAVRFGYAVQG